MILKYIWELSIVLISSFSFRVISYQISLSFFLSFLPWDVLAQLSAPLRQPALPVPVVRKALGWHLDRHLAWSPIGSTRFLGAFCRLEAEKPGLGDHHGPSFNLFIPPSQAFGSWLQVLRLKWCLKKLQTETFFCLFQDWHLLGLLETHRSSFFTSLRIVSLSPKWRKHHFGWSSKWKNSEPVQPTHPFHPRHLTLLAPKVLLEPSWFDRTSFLHQWNSPLAGAKSCNWLTGWEYHYWY